MERESFKETLKRKAYQRQSSTVDEINSLLEQLVEPATGHSERRAHPRFPVCIRLQVTPCSDAFSALGPPQVAFSQNSVGWWGSGSPLRGAGIGLSPG